jgi:SAM-dependent methyltransferase
LPGPLALLKNQIAHPLTRGMDLDDPATTQLRRRIIREKTFLKRIYDEWYAMLADSLPQGADPVLELGSGGGFMDEFIPDLITSDVFACDGLKLVCDGQRLPMSASSLRGIVMVDVLHHIPDTQAFLAEAVRCVKPGGVVSMTEPWVSTWSKYIYNKLHHEPFVPTAPDWTFPASGPLSGANGALPWIIFQRDRDLFERRYPGLRIESIRPMMPLRYLLSGGVSMRSLTPEFSFGFWRMVEAAMRPQMHNLAMFAHIVLRRTDG